MKFFDVLDYIFPRKCLGCSREEGYLCKNCENEIVFLQMQCCPNCRRPQKEGRFCHEKCAKNFGFDQLIVCLKYSKTNLISKMAIQFKYKFSKEMAEILGKIMKHQFANFSHNFKTENTVLIPVPLSAERMKFRGFNQAALLAKYLEKNFNRMKFYDCMKRENGGEQQAGKTRRERLMNLENKIYLDDGFATFLKDKNIILIDDIATTGTTLNECSRVLKNAGVKNICCLVLARGK